jgi:hypothetical protein
MPVSLPASEMEVHGIDIQLPIGAAALPRGIGIANNVTDPNINTAPAAGFFGVLVESQLANTTGAVKKVRVPACNRGLVEVLLSTAAGSNKGTPLTLDATNRWTVAAAGQKVYARAQNVASAGTYVLALVSNEGTL